MQSGLEREETQREKGEKWEVTGAGPNPAGERCLLVTQVTCRQNDKTRASQCVEWSLSSMCSSYTQKKTELL